MNVTSEGDVKHGTYVIGVSAYMRGTVVINGKYIKLLFFGEIHDKQVCIHNKVRKSPKKYVNVHDLLKQIIKTSKVCIDFFKEAETSKKILDKETKVYGGGVYDFPILKKLIFETTKDRPCPMRNTIAYGYIHKIRSDFTATDKLPVRVHNIDIECCKNSSNPYTYVFIIGYYIKGVISSFAERIPHTSHMNITERYFSNFFTTGKSSNIFVNYTPENERKYLLTVYKCIMGTSNISKYLHSAQKQHDKIMKISQKNHNEFNIEMTDNLLRNNVKTLVATHVDLRSVLLRIRKNFWKACENCEPFYEFYNKISKTDKSLEEYLQGVADYYWMTASYQRKIPKKEVQQANFYFARHLVDIYTMSRIFRRYPKKERKLHRTCLDTEVRYAIGYYGSAHVYTLFRTISKIFSPYPNTYNLEHVDQDLLFRDSSYVYMD